MVFGRWTFFCVRKGTNIQIVTHPYLAQLSKNMLEVFQADIANLARYRKCIFFIWDPNIDWFPVGPFGLMFVKNDWWGVLLSCQMMKKCCWLIWAPKSEKIFVPNFFLQIWFLDRKLFLVKQVTNIQVVTKPYLARLLKNMLEVLLKDITVLA